MTKGGVVQGTPDCDKDCLLDGKARSHMKAALTNVFRTNETNTTVNISDVNIRKKQDRKSVVLIRSLAHLLATGQQPTIGLEVSNSKINLHNFF